MKKIFFVLVVILVGVYTLSNKSEPKKDFYTYVITETGAPASLDPLEADQTNNMPVARMIYATPLEVDLKGDLAKTVLEDFDYNEIDHLMTWNVKKGLKYTDNSDLTAEDVAFAVARMIYTRPNFPVIENIQGIKEWLSLKEPLSSLPSGIKLNENRIKIQFSKKQDHPLFRFCLELFSIIPKKCVNLSTNKISCAEIPGSGHYKLISQDKNEFKFEKRANDFIQDSKVPQRIFFKYMSTQEVLKNAKEFDSQTVIAGTELRYSIDEIKDLQSKVQISFAPASRIVTLLINPNFGAFKDKKCRQVFAKAFRSAFYKIAGDARESESSLFTDLLPGYLESKELNEGMDQSLTSKDIAACKEKFEREPILWLKAKNNQKSLFIQVMEKAFVELGINPSSPLLVEDQKNEDELFLTGKIQIKGFQTGFWAFDPAGDVQMLMTPNMHKALDIVTYDNKMQSLIKDLKKSDLDKAAFKKLNQYVYNESVFNVFTHIRRFYAAKEKSLISEAPVSITSPAPWQVFKVD